MCVSGNYKSVTVVIFQVKLKNKNLGGSPTYTDKVILEFKGHLFSIHSAGYSAYVNKRKVIFHHLLKFSGWFPINLYYLFIYELGMLKVFMHSITMSRRISSVIPIGIFAHHGIFILFFSGFSPVWQKVRKWWLCCYQEQVNVDNYNYFINHVWRRNYLVDGSWILAMLIHDYSSFRLKQILYLMELQD